MPVDALNRLHALSRRQTRMRNVFWRIHMHIFLFAVSTGIASFALWALLLRLTA